MYEMKWGMIFMFLMLFIINFHLTKKIVLYG